MKKKAHIERAEEIGEDSWELINFMQLPQSSTPTEQISALQADKRWQDDHTNQIAGEIDLLIKDIEQNGD